MTACCTIASVHRPVRRALLGTSVSHEYIEYVMLFKIYYIVLNRPNGVPAKTSVHIFFIYTLQGFSSEWLNEVRLSRSLKYRRFLHK